MQVSLVTANIFLRIMRRFDRLVATILQNLSLFTKHTRRKSIFHHIQLKNSILDVSGRDASVPRNCEYFFTRYAKI